MVFLTIFRKFLFVWKNAVKSGSYGLKSNIRCIFGYFFYSGEHRTQQKTPKDPQFANVGMVVVYHENG